jgi:beta-ribofuranosylaminobenzene 5'-phosphate synthase
MAIRVSANSRIHVGLIDLAGISERAFCGVGFSISDPRTRWNVRESEVTSIRGTSHLDAAAQSDLEEALVALQKCGGVGFRAVLEESPPQHVGLGSKTSLLLSFITAVSHLKELNLSSLQIQKMSGRGGASGVGINLFFHGGIIWDGGHPKQRNRKFAPSGASQTEKPPPILARWLFPDDWLIGLVRPDGPTFSGAAEETFFTEKTPLSQQDAFQTMSSVYHGVIPAFVMADLDLLKRSLRDTQSTGLKHQELLVQSPKTMEAMEELGRLPRVAIGLSSLGPLLYGIFSRDDTETRIQFERAVKSVGANYLGAFAGSNQGFSVETI